MTSLAIGASITVGVGDSGSVVVSTNGGFGSVSVVRTEGGTTTESFGPSPLRKTFGPYGEGASVVLSNTSAGQFDYDLGPGGSGMTAAQVAALQALVSGDGMLSPRDALGWSLADAVVRDFRPFGQFADGSYLITNGAAAQGNSSTRLCIAVGDPINGFSSITPIAASGGTVGDKFDATGAQIVDGDAACQIDQAWIDAAGDVWYVQRGNPTVTNTRRYLRRLRNVAGTWQDGTDSGATNKRAVVNLGSATNGAFATQVQEIRPLHALSFCEYAIGSGGALTRRYLFAEYNVAAGRVAGGTNDQCICWQITRTGTTINAATKLLEFNTGGAHLFDHFHGVQQDPYTGNIYFTCGDTGDECALICWDGRSAPPAANSTWAQVAATPGWSVTYGDEMRRFGGLLFLPDAIVALPDGDVEATVTDSTVAQSVVIDRGVRWTMPTGIGFERIDDMPPLYPLRTRAGALIYGALRTQTANTAGEQFMHFWTSNGGRQWKLAARVQCQLAQTANIRELWEDAAGNVFASNHRNNQRFAPIASADSCVIFRPAQVSAGAVTTATIPAA